jgi:hypothetical protein
MLHKDYDRKGSVEKKTLFFSLEGVDSKAKCSAVIRQSQSNFDFGFMITIKSGSYSDILSV